MLFSFERIARAKNCLIRLENAGPGPMAAVVSIRSNHLGVNRAILSRSAAKYLAAFVSLGSSCLRSWRRRELIRTQIKTPAASSTANIKNAVSMAVRKKSSREASRFTVGPEPRVWTISAVNKFGGSPGAHFLVAAARRSPHARPTPQLVSFEPGKLVHPPFSRKLPRS